MRKRILNYVGFMIILSMVLTFVSASVIMYVKTNEWMEQDVRNEAQYVRLLLEQTTDSGWEEQAGTFTTSRITILNETELFSMIRKKILQQWEIIRIVRK